MKILLLNQTFYPDVAATGQYAAELSCHLVERGHRVTVLTSRLAYDNPLLRFPSHEIWHGIEIIRVSAPGFGKATKWRRAVDFAGFFTACTLRSLLLSRFDVVLALTSPPLISIVGAVLTRLKGGRFVFWVMDLNPDEAIAAGWLQPGSRTTRLLNSLLAFSLRRASRIVALDQFMAQRLREKCVPEHKVAVIPPWPHGDSVFYDHAGRQSFRREQALDGKFVVMYSGNHSPCHPLDTVLNAALQLRSRIDIAFCFVGGGSEFRKVRDFGYAHQLSNIVCVPYQPIEKLSASLSSADLHLVVMGDPFVGIVHPCKVYNIQRLGIPFLYIGPNPSHVTELSPTAAFRHGDTEGVAAFISRSATHGILAARVVPPSSQQIMLDGMVNVIESVAENDSPGVAASDLTAPLKDRWR